MDETRDVTTADLAGTASPAADGPATADEDAELTRARVDEEGDGGERRAAGEEDPAMAPLLDDDEARRFRSDWSSVQSDFVDRPREAVEQADRLVAELMQRLAAQFSETHTELERQWEGNDDVSTEDLRVAMTRYRSFFERLLAT